MATSVEHSPFFQQQAASGKLVVKDAPKFDLETYIANYEGRTRLDRLVLIGSTSTYLAVDAFKLAVTEAKLGKDVERYLQVVTAFRQLLPNDPQGIPDLGWVDSRSKQVKAEMERLEHELKGYKNNLIKESIRMGHEDLAGYNYITGDLAYAHRSFNRMRDYCTLPKHIAEMSMKLIVVAVAQRNWHSVQMQLQKINQISLKPDETAKIEPALDPCSGLTLMSQRYYRDAATAFLRTSPTFVTLEPIAGIMFQRELLTANDVAVYGGLCALASMDRDDLQSLVLAKSDFRQFLELEPHIRRAISLFCSSKYASCLEVLESYRTDWLLDIYLQPLLGELFQLVRTKCIVQYFIPFSCVSLDEMGKAFATTGKPNVEEELVDMIERGHLNARIDLVERRLISPPESPRHTLLANALSNAQTYESTLRLRLIRLNMEYAGLDLKSTKHALRGKPGNGAGVEAMYDQFAPGSGPLYGGEPMAWSDGRQ